MLYKEFRNKICLNQKKRTLFLLKSVVLTIGYFHAYKNVYGNNVKLSVALSHANMHHNIYEPQCQTKNQ